jgi:hypothetical protein
MLRTSLALLLLPSLALAQGAGEEPASSAPGMAEPARGACARTLDDALPDGPVTVAGFHAADFGQARRACARNEVGLGMRAGAVIDSANFYGALDGEALLFGSARVAPSLELFGTAELLRYQYVQNATLTGTSATLGQVTVGAAYLAWETERLTVTPMVRLMLPTALLHRNTRTVGLEAAAAGSLRVSEQLELHGTLGADVTGGLGAAPLFPRGGVFLNAGVSYALTTWFALVLDANLQALHRAPLDLVAPAVALRFAPFRGLGAELGATLPLMGADRHDGIFGLRLSYRL